MATSSETALAIALLALAGVLISAFVAMFTSRRGAEVDRQLLLLKTQLESELARIQQAHDQRMKQLDHLLVQRGQDRERSLNADATRLAELLRALEPVGVLQFLRSHDFGGAFRLDDVTPLRRFLDTADDPDKEFLEPELQDNYRALVVSARAFSKTLANKTWTNHAALVSVLPDEERGRRRPRWVDENAAELNRLANEVVSAYDKLIREARSRLGAPRDA